MIFAVSTSFASEDTDNIQTNSSELLSTENVDYEGSVSDMESQAEDNKLSAVSDGSEDRLYDTPGTFAELNELFLSPVDGVVELNKNYTRASTTDTNYATITSSVTVEGHGHTLDGNHLSSSRIFNVNTNSKVVFNNIIFKNAASCAVYFLSSSSQFEFNNCTFIDNAGNSGAAIYASSATRSSLVNCTFIGNNATSSGGAVYASSFTNSKLINCTFTGNTARSTGGAISLATVTNVDFMGCNFTKNTAKYTSGGAICISGKVENITFSNSSFENNGVDSTSTAGNIIGGAIAFSSTTTNTFINLKYTNVNFTNNYVTGTSSRLSYKGGAISYELSCTNVEYINCNFINNSAKTQGGAISISYSNYNCKNNTYTNVNFIGNRLDATFANTVVSAHGGAIYISPPSENTIFTNVTFDNNYIIANVTGGSNTNTYYGAGISNSNILSNTKFYNVNFTNNHFVVLDRYTHYGAGIYAERIQADYVDCNFINNSAQCGGVMVIRSGYSKANFTNSVFENNTATKNGGAIYIYELFGGNADLICNGVNFTNNVAGLNGGAIYLLKGTVDSYKYVAPINLNNTDFSHNTASNGSAIYNDKSNVANITISNSNFYSNRANATIIINYDKFYQNGTIHVTLGDNYINAIQTQTDINFNNVSYFEYENNTFNTDEIDPIWSNYKENLTVEIHFYDDEGNLIHTEVVHTNVNGYGNFSFMDGDVGSIKVTFEEDEYYAGENEINVEWGDFDILQNLVIKTDENGVLDLERNYTYTIGLDTITEGVVIDKNITIDGHGNTIDALFLSRIFNIQAGNVVLKNIRFIHGNSTIYDYGGAIFGNDVSNIQIINCGFENCTALNGGSIYLNGTDISITDCNFTENLGLVSLNTITVTKNFNGLTYYTYTETYTPLAFSPLTQYGGAIYLNGNGYNIKNSKFYNINTYAAGAIYSDDVNNVVIDECEFDHCSAGFGGAIVLNGESNHIMNSNFTNNSVEYEVYVTAAKYRQSVIHPNSWPDHYETRSDHINKNVGAIYLNGNHLSIENSRFIDLATLENVGAIYLNGNDSSIENSRFIDLATLENVGAIYLNGNNLSIEKCEFSDLVASENAGAVYINASNSSIKNSSFNNTKAQQYGLAVIWEGEYGKLINCTFEGSKIDYSTRFDNQIDFTKWTQLSVVPLGDYEQAICGGIVCWLGNHGYIKDSNFTNNYVNKYLRYIETPESYFDLFHAVSAIYVYSDSDTVNVQTGERKTDSFKHGFNVTVDNCNFTDNNAQMSTIIWSGANGTLLNSYFNNNHLDYSGTLTIQSDNTKVINSTFIKNSGGDGGAIATRGKNTKIINSTFTENSGYYGGAIIIIGASLYSDDEGIINSYLNKYGANALIDNCIFVGNVANHGGAVLTNGYKTQINNSEFYNNTADIGGALVISGFYETIENSSFENNSAFAGGAVSVGGYRMDQDYWEYVLINSNSTTIRNSKFTNNIAEVAGAVLWLADNGTITDNVLFEQNTVDNTYYRIGPVNYEYYSKESYSDMVQAILSNYMNLVSLRDAGAGIVWLGADGTVNNATFKNNKASPFMVYKVYSDWELVYHDLELEWDDEYGGYDYDRGFEIAQNELPKNYTECYWYDWEEVSYNPETGNPIMRYYFELIYARSENNTLNSSAGAIYWIGDNGLINDSTFQYNFANTGGAIYQNNSLLKVYNSRFVENKANSTELIVVNEINVLNIVLIGRENYLNAIFSENNNVEFDNITYWNGNIVNTKDVEDGTSTNESGQKIVIEVYKDGQLTTTVSELTSANGQLSIDFSNILGTGEYTYVAYHPDDSYYTYINQTGTLTVESNLVKVNLTVTVNNIVYGQNATIQVTLKDIEGNNLTNVTVNVTIKNVPYEIKITDGFGSTNVSGLAVGENYLANATFAGNETYSSGKATDLFNVTKAPSIVNITQIGNVTYNAPVDVVFNVINATNVTYTVKYANETIRFENVTIEKLNETLKLLLGAGNYTITIYNAENENYTASSYSANFTVYKANSRVNITQLGNVTYNANVTVKYTVENATTVTYTVTYANGTPMGMDDVVIINLGQDIILEDLKAGNYTITIYNAETENITASSYTANFTVYKANSRVNITQLNNVTYNANVTVKYTVENATTVTYTVTYVNGTPTGIENVEITTQDIILEDLKAGNYAITIYNAETENITASSYTANFTVYKANSRVNITQLGNVTYNANVTVKYTVENATTVTYTVTYANGTPMGMDDVVIINLGQDIILEDLKAGNYTITIYNAETENITASSYTANFTVYKANSRVNITQLNNVTYNANVTVKYTVENKTTLTYTVTYVNGTPTGIENVEITTQDIILENLKAGNYTITIYNAENENYTASSYTANFTVEKANSTLKAENITYIYGETGNTTIEYEGATKVNATVNEYPNADVTIGEDMITVTGLPVGNYTLTITTQPDENHTAVSKTVTVTVTKATSLVEIEPITNVTYTTDVTVNFNVTNATEVTYIVTTRDGTTIVIPNKTVENVNATGNVITLSDLAVGNYTITIANDENGIYAGDVKSADFTVDKAPSTLNVTGIEFYEGSSGNAPISYIGVKNITYEVVDHPEAVISVQDGVIIVSNLSAGSYVLKVTAQPDENHMGVTKEVNVIVKVKKDPEMNVTNDSPVEGKNATVTVDLPKDAKGNVTVTLKNGTNYTAAVENGKATVNVPNAPVGDNNVTVTYSGDEKYNGQSTNATVHVKKVLIDASDMKRGWDSPFDYQAKLIDEEGNPIEGKTITFTVGEKQYNATTDSNGIAKLTQTTLDVGKYDITSSYANGASSINKLEIVKRLIENNDLTMDYKDGSKYKVRAIGDDGNPVGKNVVVSISINGVTYKIKTDENGYAILSINLIPKKYTATSKYHKTTVKNKVTVKQTLKLVKKTVTVKKGKNIVLKATLKWTSGKALKGKVIKFKFKGKIYKAKTNSKGVAKVTIKNKKVLKKLKKGKKYTYSATYIHNSVKGKVKIK